MSHKVNRPESPDDVVIVSAVRTAVARGKKDGSLASTHPVELSALVMKEALDRAGVDPAIVDDVAWGCAMPEASQGLNVARLSALRAGLPVDTHVGRLSIRLGLTTETDAVKAELALNDLVPPDERGAFSLRMILHGRQVCDARRPRCDICPLNDVCPSAFKV